MIQEGSTPYKAIGQLRAWVIILRELGSPLREVLDKNMVGTKFLF